MIIKEVHLKNFGRFSSQTVRMGEGINVICGPNEAGKTTLYTAIGALLFGMEKKRGRAAGSDSYATYQPWEHKTWYEAGMRFETGGKSFYLERNFYHGEKSARLVCETDGEELSVEQGDLEMLLGEADAELFFNTAAAGQLKMKPQDIVYSYLKNHIGSLQEAGSGSIDVMKALEILSKKKKVLEQEQKKRTLEIRQQIERIDSKRELLEKEIEDSAAQLEKLKSGCMEDAAEEKKEKRGFFARLIEWIVRIFSGRKLRVREEERRQAVRKREERAGFLRELLGEKESLLEELGLARDDLYARLHEQSKAEEIKAVSLAMERIQQLSAVRREEVMEALLCKASETLQCITDGKYEKLLWEDGSEPKVWDGHRMLKLFQVSAGCADQVYLSLRIALQDLFFKEETLPLMFDDAFVYFDDSRLEQLLGYLEQLHRQVLIFSCHKREMQILEKLGISHEQIWI